MEPLFIYSAEYSINKEYLKEILLPALENLKAADEKQQKAKEYAIQSVKEINGKCANHWVGEHPLKHSWFSVHKRKNPNIVQLLYSELL